MSATGRKEDEAILTQRRTVTSSTDKAKVVDPTQVLGPNGVPLGSDHAPGTSKCASFFRRLWTSLLMFAAFVLAVHLGQPALFAVVMVVQFMMFKEVVRLAYTHLLTQEDNKNIPLFRTQNWFWFFSTMFFVYGRIAHSVLGYQTPYHTFISFSLLVIAFVGFVLSLKAGFYRVQFSMFAWVFITLIIIVLQSTMLIYNMFQGLFWFVLPAILVMSNDSWAYVWGQLFGRTPLLELSPKKTMEGFIGALICTCLTAFFASRVMINFPILTCPQSVLTFVHPTCTLSAEFVPVTYTLPMALPVLGWTSVSLAPVQIHAFIMGIFASLVAPFGGFFASGFKRAFKIKDFGDLIPGHGGLTDRMDCQLLMGVFVYVYYWTFVNTSDISCACAQALADKVDLASVLQAARKLSLSEQAELAKMLVQRS